MEPEAVMLKKERIVPRSGTRYFFRERNGNALQYSLAWKVKERNGHFAPFLLRSIDRKFQQVKLSNQPNGLVKRPYRSFAGKEIFF